MTREEFIKKIKDIEITYDCEETYNEIFNATQDYMYETKDFNLEDVFNDYIDYEIAEEIAKSEIEKGGLLRVYYFLGDANLNNNLFKIDGYGNLEDVTKDDLEILKDEILERV